MTEAARPVRAFRRRIVLIPRDNAVEAALEDNMHHFLAILSHDGERVTSVKSSSIRTPRTNCADADLPLRGFLGLPLAGESVPLDPRLQCTHLYELVRLAMACAIRGSRRQYDIDVPLWTGANSTGRLIRDGTPLLEWSLVDQMVTTPGPFAGIDIKGRIVWPGGLDEDSLEAAKVLRRGIWLGAIRSNNAFITDRREFRAAIEVREERQRGTCFAHQPGTQELGRSNDGENIFDFTDRPQDLLKGIAFA